MAVAAQLGADWDIVCLELDGDQRTLGKAGIDEVDPSWSPDDRYIAVAAACTTTDCDAPATLEIWELVYTQGAERCPEVGGRRAVGEADSVASPRWYPSDD